MAPPSKKQMGGVFFFLVDVCPLRTTLPQVCDGRGRGWRERYFSRAPQFASSLPSKGHGLVRVAFFFFFFDNVRSAGKGLSDQTNRVSSHSPLEDQSAPCACASSSGRGAGGVSVGETNGTRRLFSSTRLRRGRRRHGLAVGSPHSCVFRRMTGTLYFPHGRKTKKNKSRVCVGGWE